MIMYPSLCHNTHHTTMRSSLLTRILRRTTAILPLAPFSTSFTTPPHRIQSNNMTTQDPHLPSLIVLDLDDCLWTPEMHELYGKPSKPVQGVLNPHKPQSEQVQGVVALSNSHGQTVTIYEGGRRALYELVTDPQYKGVKIAVASTSLEPSYSYACLEAIEVLPGRTIMDVIQ
jgi:Acid Phosphatase